MRIACVYLPSFPLQAHARRAPHLQGTAFAVANGVRIVAPSQAAWSGGIRAGMTIDVARSLLPGADIVAQDPALEDATLRGLAEALLACSRIVDIGDAPASARVRAAVPGFGRPRPGEPVASDAGTHRVLFLAVPPRVRGTTFGHKLLGHIMRQGFRARVGVADDCFTAFAAAATAPRDDGSAAVADLTRQPQMFDQACHVVPGGGAAAFLSSLPLSLLPLDAPVARMLDTVGVHTLGDFAALPPPSFSRARTPLGARGAIDFRALAAGEGPAVLHALHLDRPIAERIDLAEPVSGHQPLAFVFRTLCDRAWQRLAGRDCGALRLVLTLHGARDTIFATPTRERLSAVSAASAASAVSAASSASPASSADGALASARAMLDALRDAAAGVPIPDDIRAATLEVTATAAPARVDLDLFALPEIAHGISQRAFGGNGDGANANTSDAAASRPAAVTALATAARAIQTSGQTSGLTSGTSPSRGRTSHAAGRRTHRSPRRSARRAAQGELRGLFD